MAATARKLTTNAGEFGSSRATASPAAMPWAVSPCARRSTRSASSAKVRRSSPYTMATWLPRDSAWAYRSSISISTSATTPPCSIAAPDEPEGAAWAREPSPGAQHALALHEHEPTEHAVGVAALHELVAAGRPQPAGRHVGRVHEAVHAPVAQSHQLGLHGGDERGRSAVPAVLRRDEEVVTVDITLGQGDAELAEVAVVGGVRAVVPPDVADQRVVAEAQQRSLPFGHARRETMGPRRIALSAVELGEHREVVSLRLLEPQGAGHGRLGPWQVLGDDDLVAFQVDLGAQDVTRVGERGARALLPPVAREIPRHEPDAAHRPRDRSPSRPEGLASACFRST